MNKKTGMAIIIIVLFIVFSILVNKKRANKSDLENKTSDKYTQFYYEEVEDSIDTFIIYDSEGKKRDIVEDSGLMDAQMHLYEIDPDYDGS